MRVVSRIKYYKNRSTPHHLTWFLYYRSTAFPTQIFRDLLIHLDAHPVEPLRQQDHVCLIDGSNRGGR